MASDKLNSMRYAERLKYNSQYHKAHYKMYSLRFNVDSESYYIRWLENYKSNFKEYIKKLIDKDITEYEEKK